MALHTLSDLLTGTQENCASQAFSQLCHPWNCIISLRDSRHGSGSLGRASSLRSVQLKSAGGTRLCPLRGAPRVQTHSPSPPAKVGRTCRYNLGGTPELRGGGGALSCSRVPHKPPPLQPSPSAASPPRPAEFRSPVEIPQRCQRWGLQGPAKKPPWIQPGAGALPPRAALLPPGGSCAAGNPGSGGSGGSGEFGGSGVGAAPAPGRSPRCPRCSPGSPALLAMGPACPAS